MIVVPGFRVTQLASQVQDHAQKYKYCGGKAYHYLLNQLQLLVCVKVSLKPEILLILL